MNRVVEQLEKIGCEYARDYPMNRYTSMRVGGVAGLVIYPKNHSEFLTVLDMLSTLGSHWMILGGGSNTILHEEGTERLTIVSTKRLRNITVLENQRILAEAGAPLSSVLSNAIKAELSGFEFAAGIPGTVGGGVVMNAGANEGEMKDVVEKVWIWLGGGELILSRDEIEFEYRKSDLPEGSVVTKALLKLRPGDGKESERRVKDYLIKRNATQPVTIANSGSVFKNPPEIPAGKLLEELGFKGFGIGGARFSELHANFIVNSGRAKAGDVIRLIETARDAALLRRGVRLETEIRIVERGKTWG